jgi:hypothetical protein
MSSLIVDDFKLKMIYRLNLINRDIPRVSYPITFPIGEHFSGPENFLSVMSGFCGQNSFVNFSEETL